MPYISIRESCLTGDISECAVLVVVIKREKSLARFLFRPVHRIDQQDVLPAVVVVIKKAQPVPMVSGRYFFPKAPLLCLKCIPAWAVTSVNSIGPDGRGGVGLGDGEGAVSAVLDLSMELVPETTLCTR